MVLQSLAASHEVLHTSTGQGLSRFPQYAATRSIATPPGWDASPLQVTP